MDLELYTPFLVSALCLVIALLFAFTYVSKMLNNPTRVRMIGSAFSIVLGVLLAKHAGGEL